MVAPSANTKMRSQIMITLDQKAALKWWRLFGAHPTEDILILDTIYIKNQYVFHHHPQKSRSILIGFAVPNSLEVNT
jgi:hypothetical protein